VTAACTAPIAPSRVGKEPKSLRVRGLVHVHVLARLAGRPGVLTCVPSLCVYTHIHMQMHAYSHTRTHSFTHPYRLSLTHSYPLIHHAHIHIHTPTPTPTPTPAPALSHTRTHAHTRLGVHRPTWPAWAKPLTDLTGSAATHPTPLGPPARYAVPAVPLPGRYVAWHCEPRGGRGVGRTRFEGWGTRYSVQVSMYNHSPLHISRVNLGRR
jgi:hypothetical protein